MCHIPSVDALVKLARLCAYKGYRHAIPVFMNTTIPTWFSAFERATTVGFAARAYMSAADIRRFFYDPVLWRSVVEDDPAWSQRFRFLEDESVSFSPDAHDERMQAALSWKEAISKCCLQGSSLVTLPISTLFPALAFFSARGSRG